MNNRSIAFQLSIYILTTVTVVISIVVFLNYDFNRKVLMQKIEESAINQSDAITARIAKNIVTTQEVTRNLAFQANYYDAHGDLEKFVRQVLSANKLVFGVQVELFKQQGSEYLTVVRQDSSGFYIFRDKEHCESGTPAPVRELVQKRRDGVWSNPFYCKLDPHKLVITYTQAIRENNGNVIGIISGLINLSFLNTVVSSIRISHDGYAFIVAHDGTFLTHPNKEWIMTRNIYEVSEQVFPENRDYYETRMRMHEDGSGFVYPEMYNYERSWFHFSPVPQTEWSVIILIPAKELFSDLNLILRKIIFVSTAGLLVILLVIILIFRKMLMPLSSIVRSIQRFSFGDRNKNTGKNEIELLADSLNELQNQYSNYLKEQDQSRKDRRKYEKDLKSAKEIQTAIIPNENMILDLHPEVDLFAALKPAESIGGDLYDFFFVDPDHLLFTMGDVSGKGIPAALFMAVAHTLIKRKSTVLSAGHIVEEVNNELSFQNSNQQFLTLFLGILDVKTGVLSFCNAAHNYPFIIRKNGDVQMMEKTHGLPIGVYSNKTYPGDSVVLQPGDMIVLYTDGVTDCKDSNDNFYGMDRLKENISNMTILTARELVNRLINSLKVFRGETKQADDISLMAIRYLGKKS